MDKVLGIGNALVDIMTKLPNDETLDKFSLRKGSMQLSERDFADKINNETINFEKSQSSGGSAANTIHGLASLGAPAGYIGKVGKDEFGEFFSNDMKANGIEPFMLKSNTDTGRAIALVSPDSERTFATYLGAAVELSDSDLTSEQFKNYKYLHIEGYLVLNHALMIKAAELAKANNMKISIDMASFNVVEDNLEFLKEYVKNNGDIIVVSNTSNGFTHASGIVLRNDRLESGIDINQEGTHQFAKIMFSANYGDIYAYNNNDESSYSIVDETKSKASGILAIGLLSSFNNLNFGNIYSNHLASAMIGFIYLNKFGTIGYDEVYIANSMNYGYVREILAYDAYDMSFTIDMSQSPSTSSQKAFGAIVGKIHTNTTTWAFAGDVLYPIDRIYFGYLIIHYSSTK